MRDGWQTKTLGEVCEFQRGLTYSKGDEVDLSGNVVLRAMNIDLASHRLDFSDLKYISDEVVVPESKKVRKGSLLVCTASGSKSHLGKIAYIDDDYGYAFGGFMGMLVPSSELVPTYLFYVMTSGGYEDFIAALADGMNINNLKFDVLKKFRVLYPSLPEQKRIVGILDEAFENIATAKANAYKNLQNARALFESHLRSVFTQRGEGWVEKRLGDVATTQYGLSKSMNEVGEGFRIFRMGELQDGRLIDTGRMKFADIDRAEFEKYRLRPGDTLFNRTNSVELVGKTGLFDMPGDYCFASYLVRVVPDPEVLLPRFLNHFMSSEPFRASVKRKASRSINQANINATILANETVVFPESLEEQWAVVTLLDRLRAEAQRLESIYQRKLAALEELNRSLLHEAFAGNL